jgi:hypothetical protein
VAGAAQPAAKSGNALLECLDLAHRDKSQSPEFTVGIDAKRTFVDKRSRPNLQRMTQKRSGAENHKNRQVP